MNIVKNLLTIVITFCLLTTMACTKGKGDIISNAITGNGDVVSKVIKLDPITGIDLSIYANVIITKGDKQVVTIEAQQNVIDNIKRKVKDGIWDINFDKNMRKYDAIIIHITAPLISNVAISGSGKITSESTFVTDRLDISISGSGYIGFSTKTTKIDANISGSGKLNIAGSTNIQKINIAGSGKYNFTCESKETNVIISGSGNCEVLANTKLDVLISGSGSVHYKGTPSISLDIPGSGKLVDAN